MEKKKTIRSRLAIMLVIAMFAMALGLAATPTAYAANSAVSNASNGVLQFNLVYTNDLNVQQVVATGSCFLINSNTIVTANHCTTLTADELVWLSELVGKSIEETNNRLSYTVTISRDVTIAARLTQSSAEMDFAILTLESSLQNKVPLTVRHSSEVNATEEVFAIGFPAQSANVQTINTYTSSDVTITEGMINKIATGGNIWNDQPTNFVQYLQTSCKLTNGVSGGPMLDANGNVVGICMGSTGEFQAQGNIVHSTDDYYYAVCIDQVLEVCDALGIQYSINNGGGAADATEPPASDPPVSTEPVAPTVDTSALNNALRDARSYQAADYTASSFAALENAIAEAEDALNSNDQAAVDSAVSSLQSAIDGLQAAPAAGPSNMVLYIIIGVVAVIVILVVVIIVVVNGQKKKKQPVAPMAGGNMRSAPGPAPVAPRPNDGFSPSGMNVPQRPMNTVPMQGAGETTVLNAGAGETTVLSQQVHGGTIIRKKNGERVEISKAEFVVGRDRSRVTYCISDNSNIGRAHAKFVVRNGNTYLVDMNSTNGTFVNKVKCTPNQEIALKDGDEITLADDAFEYRA